MSILINGIESEEPQGRFSFQHFDQESDFGVENEDGERVRKRKRPGRKPNPPTIQERRAQNRAAQKAFRQREHQRKEEKERLWKDYCDEIKKLKKQLSISQYEIKYLRACVLHLTLASLIHRGSVPHIWNESRIIPSNNHGEYNDPDYVPDVQDIVNEVNQTPVMLDVMLENNKIIDFDDAVMKTTQPPLCIKNSANKLQSVFYQRERDNDILTINKNSQEPRRCFPISNTLKRPRSPSPEVNLDNPSTPKSTLQSNSSVESVSSQSEDNPPSYQVLAIQQKPVVDVLLEPPTLKTADDLAMMPTLQALHILRLQLKLGSILGELTPAALLPTALQRIIPHDIRIDYIPGGYIRDRMILFRDYFDIDECFNFLTGNTIFMGGDIRDSRNWVLSPEYSLKFWFLSHQLVDQGSTEGCFGGASYVSKETVEIIAEDYTCDESTIPKKQQQSKTTNDNLSSDNIKTDTS